MTRILGTRRPRLSAGAAAIVLLALPGALEGQGDGCFGPFESVGSLNLDGGEQLLGGCSLTADGLTLYYCVWDNETWTNYIMKATRDEVNRDGSWGPPFVGGTRLSTGDDPYGHVNLIGGRSWAPRISSDGRWLYFTARRRAIAEGWDIWVAWKSEPDDPDAPFDHVAPVPDINRIESANDLAGCVSPDGGKLFYVQGEQFRVAQFNVQDDPLAGFDLIEDLTYFDLTAKVFGQTISPDGRYLVWSDATDWWVSPPWWDPRGHGRADLWMAVRPSVHAPFGPKINLPSPPNTTGDEYWPWLWDDGAGTVYLLATNGLSIQAAPTGCFGADPETRARFDVSHGPGAQAVLDAASSTPAGEIDSYTWFVEHGSEAEGPELVLSGVGIYQVTLRVATERGTCDYHSQIVEVTGATDPVFARGDANADGALDIADAIFTLSYLFARDTAPSCMDAADANDDGAVDIADAIALLDHLFGRAGDLPEPFDGCGEDPPAGESLGCETFAPCEGLK